MRVVWGLVLLGGGGWTGLGEVSDYELEPIQYSKAAAKDEVSSLRKQLVDHPAFYDSSSEREFLLRVLEVLNIPKESQVLVFSKTSLQVDRITPARPRALFFSDRYYLGWVQGGDLELISEDPVIGPVFYPISYRRKPNFGAPEFTRSNDCLRCHASSRTEDAPRVNGLVVVEPQG